jgi:hypothetical protein
MNTLQVFALFLTALDGRVVDLFYEKALSNVQITVVETGETAVTDKNGAFSFPTLPPGTWTLRAGDPPYESIEQQVVVPPGTPAERVQIGLIDNVESVEVVDVLQREKPVPGGTQITRDEIAVVPGARGDLLSALQSLPSMAQTGTLSLAGGLVIRGSGPADSRVFVDGVEVPFIFHFFNFQSVLPSEMIDDIAYAPGGFGVEYGRASGGLITVRSRRPRPEYRGSAELSFVNAAATLQGPLLGSAHVGKHDPTFAISFRRSFIDALLPIVLPDDADLSFTALPRYYDYQARLDWQKTDRWNFGLFLFASDDRLGLDTDVDNATDPSLTGAAFKNETAFLRAVSSAAYDSGDLQSRSSLSWVHGLLNVEAGSDRYLRFNARGASLRNETRAQLLPWLALRTGAEADRQDFEGNVKFPRPPRDGDIEQPNFTFDPPITELRTYTITYLGGWLAADLDLSSRLSLSAGARYDGFLRSYDHVVQPRGHAAFKLTEDTKLRASGGLYTRAPDYYDEAAQRNLDPERAWQAIGGIEHKVLDWLTLQSTAFYTWRSEMLVFKTNRNDPRFSEDAYVNRGTGRTYGTELFVQARGRRAFAWLSYTLSRSLRRDAPGAEERLFDFDQTHNLILVGSLAFGKNQQWRVGGRFQYASGRPHTPVKRAVFQSDINRYFPEFGRINSLRLEPLHQLDVRLDRIWQFRTWRLSAYLDIANVYAHPAPLQQQYSYDYSERKPVTNVPILPSLGIRGEF